MLSMLLYDKVNVASHMLPMPSLKKQWIWFSMCCHCTHLVTLKINDAVFHCAATAYLVSTERFSIYDAPAVSPHGVCDFPYFITIVFQKAADVIFFMLPPHV